jgi:hypothetical protein
MSRCGANWRGSTLTIATLEWHSGRLQHWQSHSDATAATSSRWAYCDPGWNWVEHPDDVTRAQAKCFCVKFLVTPGK